MKSIVPEIVFDVRCQSMDGLKDLERVQRPQRALKGTVEGAILLQAFFLQHFVVCPILDVLLIPKVERARKKAG